jgi:hypothetical protein
VTGGTQNHPDLPRLRKRQGRDHADGPLPDLLHVPGLRDATEVQAGRLLCLLLVRHRSVSADPGTRELHVKADRAGPIGRSLRLVIGACLMIVALPVYFGAGWGYNLRSLGIVLALAAFYTLMHLAVSRFVPKLNRWLGAVLAVSPVVLVWLFGQGGGPLFGQGEGGTGAITYVGVSLLIDAMRADSGCEVMAIPGLLLGNRTHLPCIALCAIDTLEESWRG